MERQPYVTFYDEYGASLTSRHYDDVSGFWQARTYLFLSLGIIPTFLQGRSVLEFGPGTGENATYTDSLKPSRYVLVDGSREILETCSSRLDSSGSSQVEREFHYCLFSEFRTEEQFDVVIAEACIPNQKDPLAVFRHMQSFVRPGGVFILTTVSSASWFSEIVRRLMKVQIASRVTDVDEQLEWLEDRLRPHFSVLNGMARSPRNWILDNLVQPYTGGQLFSIATVLEDLKGGWMLLGGSPRFLQDWRWYKEYSNQAKVTNQQLLEAYYGNVANLLDRRRSPESHGRDAGAQIESWTTSIWERLIHQESIGEFDLRWVYKEGVELSKLIREVSPLTADSLSEAIRWIKAECPKEELRFFPGWWGRGQQHISIARIG